MRVKFSKGIKAFEGVLSVVPRVGDIIRVNQQIEGTVDRVVWNITTGDHLYSEPAVDVVLI